MATISISYDCLAPESLSQPDSELIARALEARTNAYAPYSHFRVGSALRLSDGRIFCGSNQENSAYPSGLCAERVALFAAHNDLRGAWITDIALVGGAGAEIDEEPVFPCGACAQVLLEFESPEHPVNILCAGSRRVLKLTGAASLLPFGFGK